MSTTETSTVSLKIRLSVKCVDGKVTYKVLSNSGNTSSLPASSKKRGPPAEIESPRETKKLKMDDNMKGSKGSLPLSREKAVEALGTARRLLKFAGAIVKTQLKGNANDPVKFKHAKAIFERKQLQEIARLEAILREEDREKARLALEKVERTVVFEDNCYVLEELKKLSGYYCRSWGPHFRSPLERLGLILKADELEEGEIVRADELEEGEIL